MLRRHCESLHGPLFVAGQSPLQYYAACHISNPDTSFIRKEIIKEASAETAQKDAHRNR